MSIGQIDDICPNCGSMLSKRPRRKAKCAHCGEFIYVRTRPSDRKRVLVTKGEADALQAEWEAVLRTRHSRYTSDPRSRRRCAPPSPSASKDRRRMAT